MKALIIYLILIAALAIGAGKLAGGLLETTAKRIDTINQQIDKVK